MRMPPSAPSISTMRATRDRGTVTLSADVSAATLSSSIVTSSEARRRLAVPYWTVARTITSAKSPAATAMSGPAGDHPRRGSSSAARTIGASAVSARTTAEAPARRFAATAPRR
jgi:hypothetical protein